MASLDRPKTSTAWRWCGLCAAWTSVLLLCAATEARAQTTSLTACRGVDPGAAASAIEAGDAAVARATTLASRGRAAASRSAFEEALASYEAACAAGAELALERRAIPLARLGRPLDAIVSLDAFLAAHPLDSLPEGDRARVESNHRSLERQVTTLSITARPEATVSLADREIGRTPIVQHRVAAGGTVALTLRAPGHEDWSQDVVLEAGTTQRIAVELAPLPAEPVAVTMPESVAVPAGVPAPSADLAGASPPPTTPIEHVEGTRGHSSGSARLPWIVGTGVVAEPGLGVGIGGVVLASDRRSAMEGACFTIAAAAVPGCPSIIAEHDLGVGLAIGGFALAAVAGTVAVVLAVIPEAEDDTASLACSVGLGVACRGTF